jgi:ribose 5-phosphate isomerase B
MIKEKKVAIGCDHGGYEIKELIKDSLTKCGLEIRDFGCYTNNSVDYPDIANDLCQSIEENEYEVGILICGSGNGINMVANSHSSIRSALCWKPEIATLARQHNDANVIALPGRFISDEDALSCVYNFLQTDFDGGRHEKRVNKIKKCWHKL